METNDTKQTEDNAQTAEGDSVQTVVMREAIQNLRNEVNCRIGHGAESGGHLDYVQAKLDEMLK